MISPDWVLTAAHCVEDDYFNPSAFEVLLGTTSLSHRHSDIQQVAVDLIIMHEVGVTLLYKYVIFTSVFILERDRNTCAFECTIFIHHEP